MAKSSVRLSVTLKYRDHIDWNSSRIISRLVSLGCSLSADPNVTDLLQKEHPKILAQSDPPPPVELSVADIRWQIAAEWLEVAQWSQWRAYKKPTSLFITVRSVTPYDLLFTQNGCPGCTVRDMSNFKWPYLRNG